MALVVSRIDLQKDRDTLVDFLTRNLNSVADGKRYDWLYTKCPFGQSRAWFARDGEDGPIVGAAAAFPRRFYSGESLAMGWVLGDFCIHPHYRSLGPALKLQRACLEADENGAPQLLYDFPSTSMAAIYRRLGIEPTEQLVRMAKPLRTDRKIRERVKNPLMVRGLSAAANSLLAINDRGMKNRGPWSLSLHHGLCTEAFSALSRPSSLTQGFWIDRTADYLNWRYMEHPSVRYEILTAYRDGTLQGYAVFTETDEDASIVDWFGVDDAQMLQTLVRGAVTLLRERGRMTLSASLLQSHPRVSLLEELGFRRRESRPVILQAPRGALTGTNAAEPHWFLMDGDRES